MHTFTIRTTTNYYLVNLSVSDLLITIWCPFTSLLPGGYSIQGHYALPHVFCKLDVFYRGIKNQAQKTICIYLYMFSGVHPVKRAHSHCDCIQQIGRCTLATQGQDGQEKGKVCLYSFTLQYSVFTILWQVLHILQLAACCCCGISIPQVQKSYRNSGK